MIDFGSWDLASAQAYHETYVAAVPERVSWLHEEVRHTGGPEAAVDGTPESLVSLWDWLRKRLAEPGGPAVDLPRRPTWYDPDPARPNPYLSDGALWLIDAIGCALATLVLEEVPGARWDIYRVPAHYHDIMQNRTVLTGLPVGREVDPWSIVYSAVIRSVIHGQLWKRGELRDLYDLVTRP